MTAARIDYSSSRQTEMPPPGDTNDDREVVAAITAGDPAGIAAAYDRYAAGLYGYCHWMLHSSDSAAEALQDIFVTATATLSDFSEAPELRPWLYQVARSECRRRIRTTSASRDEEIADAGQGTDAVTRPADATNGDSRLPDLRALVRSIVAELKPREREVIELSFRHDLHDNDLAIALGVSWSRARALASRTHGQLQEALTALLIAYTRRESCPRLQELLAAWDGQFTEQTRDLVASHTKKCQECAGYKQHEMHPEALARMLPPLAPLPPQLREQVLRRCTSPAEDAVRSALTPPSVQPRTGNVAVVAAAIGVLTLIIRLVLDFHSVDLFEDEVIYTVIGRSVVSGGWPRFYGRAFFLHGPGFFYLEAGWARVFGNPPGLMAWVYEMRMLNGVLAAATAVVLVLLVTRASSMRAGVVAGLLFALEPFCIRQNDRAMLETATILWVMLGYLVFTSLIDRPPSRRDWRRAVAAGLLFGCAVLTKDEGALLTVLPLLAAAVLRWGPRRTLTLYTLATTVAVYVVYVVVVAADGQFPALWAAKTSGLQRMLGIVQTTGFHSSGGGNLTARLIAEVGYFGTTYFILALALPMVVVLLRRGRSQLHKMLALLYLAAGVTLAYALVLGTLEEQELYLLLVPSLLTVTVGTALLHADSRSRSESSPPSRRGALESALIIGATALVLAVNLATFVQWSQQPDDAAIRLIQYISAHVPAGTAIADPTAGPGMDGDVAQYALGHSYHFGPWLTPVTQSRAHVRYVLVMWGLIDEGYSDVSSLQARYAVGHDRQVFSASGRSGGQITLYILPSRPSSRHRRP